MGKQKISEYRDRLDKTLASAELRNNETIKTLIKNQIIRSSQHENEGFSEDVLEKRTAEVANFMDMLRSVSLKDHGSAKTRVASHGEWKLKQDNEEFRVMYCEGPQGTPFHSLLVEGFVDGPLDVCLCVSWESTLYKKWWPESTFPPFKLDFSKCLQKVRIGEQISLVRMKVAWPLSSREALVHFFLFEYFEDDLIVVLFNSISDVKSIDRSTHGFSNDGIPEAEDVVRIGIVGGFALQKVTMERSYFRTISSMDIKMDVVPPSLINFISRQLVGKGFRLYQKVVASVSDSDEDYSKALNDPLYARIRESLYSAKQLHEAPEGKEIKNEACIQDDEHLIKENSIDVDTTEHEGHNLNHILDPSPDTAPGTKRKTFGEIEEEETNEDRKFVDDSSDGVFDEEEIEDRKPVEEDSEFITLSLAGILDENCINHKSNIRIRPEVQEALGMLEKVISMVRENGLGGQTKAISSSSSEDSSVPEKIMLKKLISTENAGVDSRDDVPIETAKKEVQERTSRNSAGIDENRSSSFLKDANHNRIAPTSSPHQDDASTDKANHPTLNSPSNRTVEVNGIDQNGVNNVKRSSKLIKMRNLCCFGFNPGFSN